MTENLYSVPRKKWRAWNDQAREVFNRTAGVLALNQMLIKHDNAPTLNDDQWNTLAWNAAWVAADHVNETFCE